MIAEKITELGVDGRMTESDRLEGGLRDDHCHNLESYQLHNILQSVTIRSLAIY